MTKLFGVIKFEKGKSRIYPHMVRFMRLASALMLAANCRTGLHTYNPDESFDTPSACFPHLGVRFPYVSPMDHMLRGIMPDVTEVRIIPHAVPAGFETVGTTGDMLPSLAGMAFVEFYESYASALIDHFGSRPQFPPLWHFARIVRNAISHGGTINIDKPNSLSGTWHHRTYGHAENGRKIIGVEISAADIAILMIELAEDLDARNIPLPS